MIAKLMINQNLARYQLEIIDLNLLASILQVFLIMYIDGQIFQYTEKVKDATDSTYENVTDSVGFGSNG